MNILVYSFNDKIGDGLQKVTFLQTLKNIYPESKIYYTTTHTTTFKDKLNPLVKDTIFEIIENNGIKSSISNLFRKNTKLENQYFDLIIDLQKVFLRTLSLKKIPHKYFFSTCANFFFSDIKNKYNLKFKNVYIEQFYFNILSTLQKKVIKEIPNIILPESFKFSFSYEEINKNIAISPGAGNKIRQWDFEKYLMIAHKLQKNGYNIFFFLGPDEKHLLNICIKNGFKCPEWKNGELISKDITFTMGLAKQMNCLLCNDSGTAWMFEFMGVKTLKIFGVTNEKKFSRPGFSKTIQIKDYGFKNLKDFPLNIYENILQEFLKSIDAN